LKSIILILVVLFFVITPASGQLLSDATGFINRLDVQTSGHIFELKLTSNFDLTDYSFDKDQKQIFLYFDSELENNLGEIIMPQNLLSGNFTFYLNDQEFFPKIQSNEKIHFITLNFTGSGSNVIAISGSEYLSGLTEIVSIENEIPITSEISSDNYFVWFIVAGILVIIVVFVVIKFKKN
jgi:hypothetical protein